VSTRPEIPGLHHVTAITADAARNVAFYTRTLGLRLVKKTVNQDDVSAYHLFYGDARGSPGMDMTFFDWPQAAPNVPGGGTVARVSFAVPSAAALEWWEDRFDRLGVPHGGVLERRGRPAMAFADPEGQRLELVDAEGAGGPPVEPWAGSPVPVEVAVRCFYGVTLDALAPGPTVAFMTERLGFRLADRFEDEGGRPVTVLECGPGGAGAEVRVAAAWGRRGVPGSGGVHHVAFRAADDAAQAGWLAALRAARVPNSGLIDRYYFRSLYFREPGGVLFEIATDGPGFATDEAAEHLGERLALPPFLEPQRARIEAGLAPLDTTDAAAGGPTDG
jgi:glyoxalase family protein